MAKQIHYKPYERSQLSSLAQALGHGLDPNMGLQLFQGVQSGALARMQAMQAARQQALATISQSLAGLAQSNPDPAAGTALEQTLASATPGMQGPKIQGKLSDMLSQIYPTTGQPSPLYQAPAGSATTPAGLDMSDLAQVDADVHSALLQSQSDPNFGLHDARMNLMSKYRLIGIDPATLTQLYNYIGQQWTAGGGAPLTSPTSAAPAPLSSLSQIVGQSTYHGAYIPGTRRPVGQPVPFGH